MGIFQHKHVGSNKRVAENFYITLMKVEQINCAVKKMFWKMIISVSTEGNESNNVVVPAIIFGTQVNKKKKVLGWLKT